MSSRRGSTRFASLRTLGGAALLAMVATACPVPSGPGGPGGPSSTLIPVSDSTGAAARTLSADGRYVVSTRANAATGGQDVVRWDRATGTTTRLTGVDAAGGASTGFPVVSADGSVVVFTSTAGALTATYSVATAGLQRLDVTSGSIEPLPFTGAISGYALSGDGSTVAADLGATVQAWHTGAAGTTAVTTSYQPSIHPASLSDDGRYLTVFEPTDGPSNYETATLNVYDLQTGTVRAAWTGGTMAIDIFLNLRWNFAVGATLADGSVIFGYGNNEPVLRLDGPTGNWAYAGGYNGITLTGGSRSGQHVIYLGPYRQFFPDTSYQLDVQDRTTTATTRLNGSGTPTATNSTNVSDDGRYVLISSTDLSVVPSPGTYLLDRQP